MIKPLVTSEKGKEVKIKPEIVIEVTYEEIQKSPSYSSGYALRFPRLSRLRDDRAPEECSSLEMVKDFYKKQ
jgi:DNA ligase-1